MHRVKWKLSIFVVYLTVKIKPECMHDTAKFKSSPALLCIPYTIYIDSKSLEKSISIFLVFPDQPRSRTRPMIQCINIHQIVLILAS